MKAKEFNNLVTPKTNNKFGAPIGRNNINKVESEIINGQRYFKPIKTTTRRVYLCSCGYDKGGAYWGLGSPLYATYSKCGKIITYFRN